jgi:uroporphyrinogen-III synthase
MHSNSREINLLIPSSQMPLYGKRILVTAPRNYASRLSEQIIQKGGLPVLMPTIETCHLANYSELDTAIKCIDKFNWIAFTSRNGIIAFFERMNDLDIPITALQNCKLAALGKDAELLLSLSGRVDLIPAELSKYPQIHEQTVLVTAPEVVGIPEPNVVPNFISDLHKLGMKVTRIPTYMTQCLDKNIYAVELNLIRQEIIDVIAFSSTAEVESFLTMVNSKSDYEYCVVACFGPYTAANAQKLGVNVSIVSNNYSSFAGFVEAIATFLTLGSK